MSFGALNTDLLFSEKREEVGTCGTLGLQG